MPEKVFNVDMLARRSAGRITISGAEYEVRQITGGQHAALKGMTPETAVEITFEVAAEVVPTAEREVIYGLTIDQANAVVAIAGAGVAAVEAMFPNSSGPEEAVSSPDSGPSI